MVGRHERYAVGFYILAAVAVQQIQIFLRIVIRYKIQRRELRRGLNYAYSKLKNIRDCYRS